MSVARCHYGRNAPATDMLSDANNNPHHTGIREDGTFIEDQVDATGNSLDMIPCGAQPDPIVSQQAIVTTHAGPVTEDSTTALVVHQTPCGLRNLAWTYAGCAVDNPIRGISFREDGTMYGPGIDEEVRGVSKQNCTTKTHGIQGSEQQDEGRAYASPQIANSQSEAIIDHQDDPQDVDLERRASADSERGAIDDPQDTNLLKGGLINDPQDVGLGREEQVDPQPTPAPVFRTLMETMTMSNNLIRITTQTHRFRFQVLRSQPIGNLQPYRTSRVSYITMWILRQGDTSYGDLVILLDTILQYLTTMVYLWKQIPTTKAKPLNKFPSKKILKKVSLRVMVKYQHSYQLVKAMLEMMAECLDLYEIQAETHSIRTHMQHLLMIPTMRCRM